MKITYIKLTNDCICINLKEVSSRMTKIVIFAKVIKYFFKYFISILVVVYLHN